ncbi:MAG: isoleucine--tRNA ligase [Bacteroidota bacterium]
MGRKYPEYKQLSLTAIHQEILEYWADHHIFEESLKKSENNTPYIFYEGPPSANGLPGIHHVLARSIKDIFCRYKTLKGYYVSRKAGWDTHGLPVELGVEKTLGITKEDIGKTISIEEYNQACRKEVMKYKDLWDDLTVKMGYWVDLNDPYITFDNKYIESVWYLLKQMDNKGLLYKGYTIQPFSPAAGTGLSSHELNMPGCYRDVKDTTCVAQFKIKNNQSKITSLPLGLTKDSLENTFFLAWTTTPWTLPSNTALAVGGNIDYVLVDTFNPYLGNRIQVILAKPLLNSLFPEKNAELAFEDYKTGDKNIPFKVIAECKGTSLKDIDYEQLIPWVNPGEGAFRVILGDYVTTEDGTGIVHIAPTFGADDDRVAKAAGVPPLILIDENGFRQPMVDRQGKLFKISELDADFVKLNVNTDLYSPFAGKFVKTEYDTNPQAESLDVELCVMLKMENKAFKIEKHTHNYPHCWRTDKPILYYPLDSWFVKTTDYKKRMIELNKTINWKPESTGTGRFGNWLENLVDWNLSRSRFWGIPIPIWVTEDKSEQICIGSIEELVNEIDKAVKAGVMESNPFGKFVPGDMSVENYLTVDLHRPYADDIMLVSASGKPMRREPDLIDVWFDSGAMPYAQLHYPFENKELFEKNYPADFIAEGVDQTRGWFFTLHAIATMLFDSVAFKNVVSNGLVLDKNGNKMSKRLGNAADPFETLAKYGADATRWYMITNAQPWDNLKFDLEGIGEVQRKFFGTLYNTYSFFALYSNIDGFTYAEKDVPFENRPEIDRWILSELNTLIKNVDNFYAEYEPTKAGREIQHFVDEYLSNWYVRLSRRRFWKGEYSEDKISAYQTLYTCLITLAKLSSPIAPFFADKLFLDLNTVTQREDCPSIHMSEFPTFDESIIDKKLEERMQLAQKISSMVLSLRKKSFMRVRQPLSKIMIPILDQEYKHQIQQVESLILHEVNVKEVQYISESDGILVRNIKPNFKTLGPRFGKLMKQIAAAITEMNQEQISTLERDGNINVMIDGAAQTIELGDVDIFAQDIPGWAVANEGLVTIALDLTLTDELYAEGLARDFVNRIQNIRKEQNFDVTDTIQIFVEQKELVADALLKNISYICSETLADKLEVIKEIEKSVALEIELTDEIVLTISVLRNN